MNSKVYICGPMTGHPEFNYPAFERAALKLRELGYEVIISPHELNPNDGSRSWQECMRVALKALSDCDKIVCLPGWEKSKGANLEVYIARHLEMEIEDF